MFPCVCIHTVLDPGLHNFKLLELILWNINRSSESSIYTSGTLYFNYGCHLSAPPIYAVEKILLGFVWIRSDEVFWKRLMVFTYAGVGWKQASRKVTLMGYQLWYIKNQGWKNKNKLFEWNIHSSKFMHQDHNIMNIIINNYYYQDINTVIFVFFQKAILFVSYPKYMMECLWM